MAIKLTSKPNTGAPDSADPYGTIRNNTGSSDGTPVSKDVYQDFHIFFERLMDKAGLTHNGMLDNITNGFQLYDAFAKLVAGPLTSLGTMALEYTGAGASSWTIAHNRYNVYNKQLTWDFKVTALAGLSATNYFKVRTPNNVRFKNAGTVMLASIYQDNGSVKTDNVCTVETGNDGTGGYLMFYRAWLASASADPRQNFLLSNAVICYRLIAELE